MLLPHTKRAGSAPFLGGLPLAFTGHGIDLSADQREHTATPSAKRAGLYGSLNAQVGDPASADLRGERGNRLQHPRLRSADTEDHRLIVRCLTELQAEQRG
ncbi:MAG: hypothetical protein ACO3VQ_10955 [Ilumatobacteraceae bacterium]